MGKSIYWRRVPFKRLDPFPLDETSLFLSYADAEDYVWHNSTAYLGQIISVFENEKYQAYIIDGGEEDKKLVPIGEYYRFTEKEIILGEGETIPAGTPMTDALAAVNEYLKEKIEEASSSGVITADIKINGKKIASIGDAVTYTFEQVAKHLTENLYLQDEKHIGEEIIAKGTSLLDTIYALIEAVNAKGDGTITKDITAHGETVPAGHSVTDTLISITKILEDFDNKLAESGWTGNYYIKEDIYASGYTQPIICSGDTIEEAFEKVLNFIREIAREIASGVNEAKEIANSAITIGNKALDFAESANTTAEDANALANIASIIANEAKKDAEKAAVTQQSIVIEDESGGLDIPSGTPISKALQDIVDYFHTHGGGGKVKDIKVNDISILNEDGEAVLNVKGDGDIDTEMVENTLIIKIKSITNGEFVIE